MKISHLLFSTAVAGFAVAMASGAEAADMYRKAPPATPIPAAMISPVTVHDWSGLYGGIFGEYGLGPDRMGVAPPIYIGYAHADGFGFGANLGYNLQNGSLVYGLEADFVISNMRDTITNPATFGATGKLSMPWYATFRPRVGYAVGDFLFYGTGGLVVGGIDTKITTTAPAAKLDDKATRAGLTAGGGIEYALSKQLSLKSEYLYTNLETKDLPFGAAFSTRTIGVGHHFRVGVNYHF